MGVNLTELQIVDAPLILPVFMCDSSFLNIYSVLSYTHTLLSFAHCARFFTSLELAATNHFTYARKFANYFLLKFLLYTTVHKYCGNQYLVF